MAWYELELKCQKNKDLLHFSTGRTVWKQLEIDQHSAENIRKKLKEFKFFL